MLVRRHPKKTSKLARPLRFEALEGRQLLAANLTATLSGGVLKVEGTEAADTIVLRQRNGAISIDNIRIKYGSALYSSISQSLVNSIEVYALGGNDKVYGNSDSVVGYQAIVKPMKLYGGEGNDLLIGGNGADSIYGYNGADTVYGGPGNDTLDLWYGADKGYGGAGNDTIYGSYDNDTLYGDSGNDTLYGYTGNDTAYGGDGNDTLDLWYGNDTGYGGNGNDIVYGSYGDDWLYGEAGADKLYGYDGSDKLYGGSGNDYLKGGRGGDRLEGGSGTDTFRRSMTGPSGFNLSEDQQDPEDELADEPQMVAGAFLTNPTSDSFWHIDQAQTPTCSFLAGLAATAYWTGRFSNLGSVNNDLLTFIQYNSSSDTYGVLLKINGSWTRYWVNGDWTEGVDPGGPLWVTLYQKAWLKANSVVTTYADGTAMNPDSWYSTTGAQWKNAGRALTALTGYTNYWTSYSSASASTMRSQLANGDVLVASSDSSNLTSRVVGSHSYMVYSVYSSNSTWYVKLYNPWGHDGQGTNHDQAYDGVNDGMITLTWSQFKDDFSGYYRA